MTEEEWQQAEWSPAELRIAYENSDLAETRREHAFWRYWIGYVDSLTHYISHSDLEEILSHESWPVVSGEIIARCIQRGRMAEIDAEWVCHHLTPGSWPRNQVEAFMLLNDDTSGCLDQLDGLLRMRADWAVYRILDSIPQLDIEKAEKIILASARPEKAKGQMLNQLWQMAGGVHAANEKP